MTTYDTQTTDENGVAELTSPAQNSSGTKSFIVKHGTVEYPVSVNVVEIGDVNLDASKSMVGNGESVELYASVLDEYQNPLEGVKVTINDITTQTNEEGVGVVTYTNDGSGGAINVTASCGNLSDTITIDNVIMYWSMSEQKKINLDYSKRGQLSIEETMTGILIISSQIKVGSTHLWQQERIFFKNPYRISESWEFSFKIVGILKAETLLWVSLSEITDYVKNGSEVRVTFNKTTGVRKVFVDDVEVSSNTNTSVIDSDIMLQGRIRIDDVKLMKV